MYKKILVPIDILEDELSQELITHIEQIAQVGKTRDPLPHRYSKCRTFLWY